jgi:hypothetical protein
MIHPVSAATRAQAAPQAQPVTRDAASLKTQASPTDTVRISSAAAQALKEAIEDPAQTAKEAAGGDAQARRLLAKEAAEKVG